MNLHWIRAKRLVLPSGLKYGITLRTKETHVSSLHDIPLFTQNRSAPHTLRKTLFSVFEMVTIARLIPISSPHENDNLLLTTLSIVRQLYC